MGILNKEALLAATALPRERVDLPELGKDAYIYIQGMTGSQRDEWETSLVRGRGNHRKVDTLNIRAKLVVRCAVNDDGSLMFTNGEAEAVGQIRVDVLQRLFEVAQRLSGVSDKDADELERRSAAETAG
jgi:hypothetical protein